MENMEYGICIDGWVYLFTFYNVGLGNLIFFLYFLCQLFVHIIFAALDTCTYSRLVCLLSMIMV
jgi:hypothetical protein